MRPDAQTRWSLLRRWLAGLWHSRTSNGPTSPLCELLGVREDANCDLRSSLRLDGCRLPGRVVRCNAREAWFAPRLGEGDLPLVASASLELVASDSSRVAHVAVTTLARGETWRFRFVGPPVVFARSRTSASRHG